MSDDLIGAVEKYLRDQHGPDNQCLGCEKVLDGLNHLAVIHLNENDEQRPGPIVRVCSWACAGKFADLLANL